MSIDYVTVTTVTVTTTQEPLIKTQKCIPPSLEVVPRDVPSPSPKVDTVTPI